MKHRSTKFKKTPNSNKSPIKKTRGVPPKGIWQ